MPKLLANFCPACEQPYLPAPKQATCPHCKGSLPNIANRRARLERFDALGFTGGFLQAVGWLILALSVGIAWGIYAGGDTLAASLPGPLPMQGQGGIYNMGPPAGETSAQMSVRNAALFSAFSVGAFGSMAGLFAIALGQGLHLLISLHKQSEYTARILAGGALQSDDGE